MPESTVKGAYVACLFFTLVTFVWAAPRGYGLGDGAPEPVQRGPSVRAGSSTWIWLGSGGK